MNTFIKEYQVSDHVCDTLINLFETSDHVIDGMIGNGRIDKEFKNSSDIDLSHHASPLYLYYSELVTLLQDYIEKYNCKGDRWAFMEGTNLQRYEPKQGYHAIHYERSDCNLLTYQRRLVFMTYLNTLTNTTNQQGSTYFPEQEYYGKPIKGNTLIWPADFTHPHKGISHQTETKYIITGWYHLAVP